MTTPVLLLNAGSSSIKYQVIDADDERVLATGLIERIGQEVGRLTHTVGGEEFVAEDEISGEIKGSWASYTLRGIWRREDHVLQLLCLLEL